MSSLIGSAENTTIVRAKRPTITDVARASGVAKSTVSVVLNSTPAAERVPEETRQRVRAIAGQLGYSASWRARALAEQKTRMIGVLYAPPMPLIARGNYEGILAGINEVLQARGYHMLLLPLGENPVEWRKMLMDQRIDGAIVLSRMLPALADIVMEGGQPRMSLALVNAETEHELPMVLADDYGGAKESVEYLLSLGHRRITFLQGTQPAHYSVTQRVGAYRDAMSGAGCGEHVRIVTAGGATEFADTFAVEFATSPATAPTAVVCYTHHLAIKLLQELWERGLKVPADVSVSCFANVYPVADVIPPLTTVALATEQMGRTAAEMVLEQIETENRAAKRRVVLRTSLVVRRSTAAPRESKPPR